MCWGWGLAEGRRARHPGEARQTGGERAAGAQKREDSSPSDTNARTSSE